MMLNRKESIAPAVHQHHRTVTGGHHHHHHHHHHHQTAPPPPAPMRPHSTPATLLWLEDNYEMAQGVCVPRNTLYLHYVDFCSKHGMTPVNAASFGKVTFFPADNEEQSQSLASRMSFFKFEFFSRRVDTIAIVMIVFVPLTRLYDNNFRN